MTTPTIRDLCAALAGDVDYLIACIRDGSSDSCALQECLDRANTARDLLAAEPGGEGPTDEDVLQELIDVADDALLSDHPGDVVRAGRRLLARWGRPAAPPAPEPPAEALAARPLLEQMVRMVNRPAAPTWGELLTLSSRAAAWLEENPPGQPVAIEPRGCPIPGACSCVEPTLPAPEAGDVGEDRWYPGFADWLERERPEGTVIGDPLWWASKIASYLTREARLAAPKIPAEGEAGEVVEWLRQRCNLMNPKYEGYEIVMLTRAYTLLEQQSAPAPVPVPVPVSERLPGEGDCDAEGRCWLFSKVESEWRLLNVANPGVPHLKYCFSHWLPAHAIPLPHAGEVPNV